MRAEKRIREQDEQIILFFGDKFVTTTQYPGLFDVHSMQGGKVLIRCNEFLLPIVLSGRFPRHLLGQHYQDNPIFQPPAIMSTLPYNPLND